MPADRGYDALPNFEHVAKRKLVPVTDVRRPPKDKETKKRRYDGLYDKKGRPVCVGGKSMTYIGTDSEGEHWFRCPTEGCHLKGRMDWGRYCDLEHSEKPTGTLLRIMGSFPGGRPVVGDIKAQDRR